MIDPLVIKMQQALLQRGYNTKTTQGGDWFSQTTPPTTPEVKPQDISFTGQQTDTNTIQNEVMGGTSESNPLIQAVKHPIEAIKGGIKNVMETGVALDTGLQEIGKKVLPNIGTSKTEGAGLETLTPNTQANIDAKTITAPSNKAQEMGGIASNLLPIGDINVVKAGAKGALNVGKDVLKESGDALTKRKITKNATKLAKVVEDWTRPVKENTASFNKTRQIYDKTPDIPKFLAEQRINPSTHIEDGRFVTKDSAQALRDTAGKISSDTLRPSLQMADYTTPKTAISELETNAIAQAKETKGITAGNMEQIIGKIKQEASSLQKKFPDGISLTDMQDNKITYAKNGGYSPVNDPLVNNTATANRSFSSAMQKMVETKAPKDVPVEDFNKYLSKYYKSADYLDSLHTKKAPVTLGQQISRGIAKFGGAAIGGHFGGGVVSEFAGYQIGKAIEHALENLSNPARESFLRNLKVTNPEAFTKVEQYLGKEKANQAIRALLPKPSMIPMGESKVKISPDSNKVQVLKADKGKVGVDKKGKFIKTYKSTGTKEEKPMKTVNPLIKR